MYNRFSDSRIFVVLNLSRVYNALTLYANAAPPLLKDPLQLHMCTCKAGKGVASRVGLMVN